MPQSSPVLTRQEKVLLQKYYEFYRSLETGKRKPNTEAQKHFVAVCRGHAPAETLHEKVYAKFMRIRAVQRRKSYEERKAQNDIPEFEEGDPQPDWFNDDDWKKLRGQDFADMRRRHHE
ncbi:MAG: DUF413 domain-containing protein [candidate division KSB1 bacterium]|nr:DUF413 domain-containing protein [candidate division KSB1 bacterium]MDZ7304429.1 DUF413 domain-containing protein [candidate division KSB1 bacterium]MDZ7310922.1 DUF413 domain-containing protein [candidate division KSB1 bacterium]